MNADRAAIVEAGFFGSESLFVSFDFTQDALLAAGAQYLQQLRSGTLKEMPSEVKTYVHELTHYLHYTTTPYGLFLQYCRVMQSRATIVLVRALLDGGIGFRMPLLKNLPEMSDALAAEVRPWLSIWLNVENLAATLHGDMQRRQELLSAYVADGERVAAGKTPLLPPLLDLKTVFLNIQTSMADLLDQENAEARAAGNPQPMQPAVFDRAALSQERQSIISGADWADLRVQDALDLLGSPVNVEAIIESAATIAEFWDASTDFKSFVAWVNAEVDPELRVYRTCISDGLRSIKTESLPQFVLSYMALCELAMFSPLLPHHAPLRMRHPDLRQILPIHRWMELLRVAAEVMPMRGTADYARYATDLCQKLGWVHPLEIIKTAMDGPEAVSDPLATIYLLAQRRRAQSLSDFFGVNRYLFQEGDEAAEWRRWFNFVILDYTDRTTYHPDKGFLKAMTTRSLNMLGMRCILLGSGLKIAAPYRGNQAEREWMTGWLRQRFKSLFNRDFAALQVV